MFAKFFRSRRTIKSNRKPFRPLVEGLETRLAPANVDWINPNGGDWHTVANWRDRSTGQHYVPGSDDDAGISGLTPGSCVTFNGGGAVKTLVVLNCLSLEGGTLTVLNPTEQSSNISTLNVWNGATLQVSNGRLGTGTAILTGALSSLDAAAGATLGLGSCGGPGRFEINDGAVLTGEGQYVVSPCHTLIVNTPLTLPTNFRVEGGLVANAETTAGQNYVFGVPSSGGIQDGPASFIVPDGSTMTWTRGTLRGPGSLEVQARGTLNIEGGAGTVGIVGRDLNNAGTVVLTATHNIDLDRLSTFNNLEGGVFDFQGGNIQSFGQPGAFNNAGRVLRSKTAGEGLCAFVVPFHNTGWVEVAVGTLRVGPGTSGGVFDVADGAVIWFRSSTGGHTLDGAELTGAGLFRVGSTVTLATDLSVGRLELSSPDSVPRVDVSEHTLTVTNTLDIQRGGPVGTGRIIIEEAAILNVTDAIFGNVTLDNFGTAIFTGRGSSYETQGVFNNQPTGTVVVDVTNSVVGLGTFSNQGLFFMATAGNGNVLTRSFLNDGGYVSGSGTINGPVTNNGWIEVGGFGATGILRMGNDFTQTADGVLSIELGGTIAGTGYDQLTVNGTVRLDGTLLASILDGYEPAAGDLFEVLTWRTRQGEFANLPEGLEASYGANGFTLRA